MRLTSLLLVVSLTLVSGLAVAAPHVNDETELRVLNQVNRARVALGLPALRRDEELRSLARYHSADMAFARFVSAISPIAGPLAERAVERAGLASSQQVTALVAVGADALVINSALLDPALTRIGIGVVEDHGQLYLTELAVTDNSLIAGAPAATGPGYASTPPHHGLAAFISKLQQAFSRFAGKPAAAIARR